jgi:hypothetical protein
MTTIIMVSATSRLPAITAMLAGRNVVIAPSAKIQALGLIHWNAAAWTRLSGRLTS